MSRPFSFPVLALVLSAAAAASGSIATAENVGAPWGARDPAICAPLKQEAGPDAAQATALVRCNGEIANTGSGELWLMEDIKVEVGAGIPFVDAYGTYDMPEADAKATVYPLRGSFIWSVCSSKEDIRIGGGDPALNCRETDVAKARGVCWATSFGEWKCVLTGPSGETRRPTAPRG